MVRAPYYDEHGTKKGAWSKEEDQILKAYLVTHGPPANWRLLPKSAGLARCGKSCRLRWMNYLRPNIKRGNFTREEEETIINLHQHLGNKWSLIAEKLPGRSDNEIKNQWHGHIKKRLERNEMTSQFKVKPGSASEGEMIQYVSESINSGDLFYVNILESSESIPTESSYRPSPNSNQEESTMNWANYPREESILSCQAYESFFSSSFWTEPFVVENNNDNQAYYDPISIYRGDVEAYFSYPYDYTDCCTR